MRVNVDAETGNAVRTSPRHSADVSRTAARRVRLRAFEDGVRDRVDVCLDPRPSNPLANMSAYPGLASRMGRQRGRKTHARRISPRRVSQQPSGIANDSVPGWVGRSSTSTIPLALASKA